MINIELIVNEKQWCKKYFWKDPKKSSNSQLHQNKEMEFKEFSQKILSHCFKIIGFSCTKSELSLVFTNDKEMQKLNFKWRHKNKTTNVLSFPCTNTFDQPNEMLGDIVFSYETIKKEAIEKNISFRDHFIHLFVHGFLHLMGYDHQETKEAEQMEQLEINILERLSIQNPYQI